MFLVLALGAILYRRGGILFSPGGLSAGQPRNEPLAGYASHAEFEALCASCHVSWRGIAADRCEVCHTVVASQRVSRTGLHGRLTNTEQCQKCHSDHNGPLAEITSFDPRDFEHEQMTGFSLIQHLTDYDNTAISCQECHLDWLSEVVDTACVSCHDKSEPNFIDDHSAFYGETCLACHDGLDTMANFDHEQIFPLEAAHATAQCEDCHQGTILAGTPEECVGCHQEPAVHLGLFGADCTRCHSTEAWTPAQLTQHNFPLDHGDEGKIACETCHLQMYTEHTCTNCHAHRTDAMRDLHLEEGIVEFEDCVACHPTGQEGEAERDED